ncbi:hypothetical protein L1049_024724 [Liquidambar formosana]|uniref:Very-long-chain (3R)-3-hydroxyacyl-CoA dehydratase n=1 Tax=Liquidambar formosana TaxID=63359 RepID=A0AAP0S1Z1_LIQFO
MLRLEVASIFSSQRRVGLGLHIGHQVFNLSTSSKAYSHQFQVLYFALRTLKESGHEHVYNAVERPLQFAQTAAVLEIIRYSFFGTKEALGFAPSWLLWLRYSTFLLLYPTGITSEVGLTYIALPYMKFWVLLSEE